MTGYQWTVLFAAWLGWGFDAFDAFLFNYVSAACVPDLLNIDPSTPEARSLTLYWTGVLTSVLLVGWAIGGIGFGKLADRIGRSRTLILTILIYSLGTAACAFAPNLWVLGIFRFITSLGIGGEWAAGAAMVAEVVPEKRRLEAGAILYSAAPLGVFMAGYLSDLVSNVWMPDNPDAWRYVFLFGLVPAVFAMVVRHFVKEPETWEREATSGPKATFAELFSPQMRQRTFSGASMAVTALLAWWSCNAFLPLVTTVFAEEAGTAKGLSGAALKAYVLATKSHAIHIFNAGGLLGTFAGLPLAHHLGRRATFGIYFLLSGLSIMGTFGLDLPMPVRLGMFFLIGLTGFGALGSFTYYLPELFPTHLRATGSGFCYNIGRFLTAAGPFVVAHYASQAAQGSAAIVAVMPLAGLIPLAALLLLPWVVETKDQALPTSKATAG
jgi:MFS family permease